MRKFFIFLTFVFYSLTSTFFFAVALPHDTSWDPAWNYTKVINITENSGEDLTDYQLFINITYEDEMQPDFDDIRFTYYDPTTYQETEIPYWIEDKIDEFSAGLWIRIPSLPANSNAIVKMYYGNENAASESNGSNVFMDFDDFEYSDTPENHGWRIAYGNKDTIIETSTNYAKTGNRSLKIFDPYGVYGSKAWAVIERNNLYYGIADIWFRDIFGGGAQVFRYQNLPDWISVGIFESISLDEYVWGLVNNNTNFVSSKVKRTENWHKFTIKWTGAEYKIFIDSIYVSSKISNPPSKLDIGAHWEIATGILYWDNLALRKYAEPEPTYIITDLPPQKPLPPQPTDRSLIITNKEWKNIISAISTKLPLIVSDSPDDNVYKFINEYNPDYIYTLGLSLGFNNSYQIEYSQVPSIFFANSTQAIYAEDRTKAILGSNLAYYLGLPIIFNEDSKYELIDLENMAIEEIQDLYLDKLTENGDNTNYLILTSAENEESSLAGYLAGLRKGFIIFIDNKSVENIHKKIEENNEYLKERGLFSGSVDYKKGDILYLAIIGGNDSVPFWHFRDPAFEVLNNKDGDILYSDLIYGDINKDGMQELAVGRLDGGMTSIALNLARQRLPKGNKAVLIGEYRHGKIIDAMNMFGGMSQAWFIDNFVLKGFEVQRTVEKRIEFPNLNQDLDDFINEIYGQLAQECVQLLLGPIGKIWSYSDLGISAMYSVFEFDWKKWPKHNFNIIPDHLPVVSQDMNENISKASLVGYFGLGDSYWLIPPQDRNWVELYFRPYDRSANFTSIDFSGFLYDDHDLSADSEIKKQVLEQGGSVLGSSGVIHDTYTAITSACFFSSLASGKSLGESLKDMINSQPAGQGISIIYPSASFTKSPYLYIKDISERILFADPAYRPASNKYFSKEQLYSIKPSNSFTIESEIESNYTIDGREITFHNADAYLVEKEEPLIPMFVREFLLPTNALLKSVNVDIDYSRKSNLDKKIIYNDSYYSNYSVLLDECIQEIGIGNSEPTSEEETKIYECLKNKAAPKIDYPYPNESYWYKTQKLLDNRTVVYVYVPAILHKNRLLSNLVEDARITVEYESAVELFLETGDIGLDQNENIKITLSSSDGEISGELLLWIEGNESWNFSESITIPTNSSVLREFSITPCCAGSYEVRALFISNDLTIGPRISYFEVGGLDFEANKKFAPSEVRFYRKVYMPPVNFPQINIKNTGILDITSINITDEIPAGFKIPGHRQLDRIEVEKEFFDTDDKIPVFIFLVTEENNHLLKKGIKMLNRKYYNATLAGNKLLIITEDFSKTNFGRDLDRGDTLLIKYIILSDKVDTPLNTTTSTIIDAFSDEFYSEKTIKSELLIK
jgi:hypothetical protein